MASSDGVRTSAGPVADVGPRGDAGVVTMLLDQLFDGRSLFPLRSAVAARAMRLGLAERRVTDLVLIANELATNAVRHGGRRGRLRLWCDRHTVYCQVTDGGPGLADPDNAGKVPVPIGATGGRGLWIVRQLCDRLHIASGPDGATLTATITVPAPASA